MITVVYSNYMGYVVTLKVFINMSYESVSNVCNSEFGNIKVDYGLDSYDIIEFESNKDYNSWLVYKNRVPGDIVYRGLIKTS